jgi:hypothetical protein
MQHIWHPFAEAGGAVGSWQYVVRQVLMALVPYVK